jgi:short-subunit dehydrogenase
MVFNNKLKIALITGGTRGVGYEIAKMFKRNNYNVIITGRKESEAIKISEKLNDNDIYSKGVVKGYKLDFTDINDSNKLLNKLENKDIRPNFIINNAGTLNLKNINDISLKEYEIMLKVNTIGPLILSKYCLDILKCSSDKYSGILFNTPPYNIDDKTTYLLPYMQTKLAQTTLMSSLANLSLNNNAVVCGFWTNYPLLTDAIIKKNIGKNDNCMHPKILSKTLEELIFNTKNPTHYNSKVIIDKEFLKNKNVNIKQFKIGNNTKNLDDLFMKHLNINQKKNMFYKF